MLLLSWIQRSRGEAAGWQYVDFKAFLVFIQLPIATTPETWGQLTWWLRVALMPSPKASPSGWVALLDGHLGVTISDSLTFATLASPDHKLLWSSRCTPRAIAGQFSRIHHLPHRYPKRQESSPGATVVPSGGSRRTPTAA